MCSKTIDFFVCWIYLFIWVSRWVSEGPFYMGHIIRSIWYESYGGSYRSENWILSWKFKFQGWKRTKMMLLLRKQNVKLKSWVRTSKGLLWTRDIRTTQYSTDLTVQSEEILMISNPISQTVLFISFWVKWKIKLKSVISKYIQSRLRYSTIIFSAI